MPAPVQPLPANSCLRPAVVHVQNFELVTRQEALALPRHSLAGHQPVLRAQRAALTVRRRGRGLGWRGGSAAGGCARGGSAAEAAGAGGGWQASAQAQTSCSSLRRLATHSGSVPFPFRLHCACQNCLGALLSRDNREKPFFRYGAGTSRNRAGIRN
jgi:hypothetical protein